MEVEKETKRRWKRRRKNDFKGFERSISGREIARRTFHPYFFASIVWTS